MEPLWFLPTIISTSKSPVRFYNSTILGRLSILILFFIEPFDDFPEA
jgi:hypothetical protein